MNIFRNAMLKIYIRFISKMHLVNFNGIFSKLSPMVVIWLIMAACSEKIELELGDTYSRLVVEATLTDRHQQHELLLTGTSSFFANEASPDIAGAKIFVSSDTGKWQFLQAEPGRYVSKEEFTAISGHEYRLEIEYKDLIYRASSVVRPVPAIDSLSVGKHVYLKDHLELRVHFQDPPEMVDFYMWKVYLNGEDLTDSAVRLRNLSDENVNGKYLHLPFFLFQPENGLPREGDHIRVEMYSISEEYFNFLGSMRRNRGTTGGPFNGPPANIPGNIDNGALGFFLATSVTEAEMSFRNQ